VLVLFLTVQFFGLLLVTQLYNNQPSVLIQSYQVSGAPPDLILTYTSAIIIFSLLMIILLRHATPRFIFLLIEAFAVLVGSFFTFLLSIAALFGMAPLAIISFLFFYIPSIQIAAIIVAAIVLSVLLLIAKKRFPRLRNSQ